MRKFGSLIGGALALAFAVLAITTPVSARAQDTGAQSDIARDWNLRLGVFIFNNQAARAASGSVGISGIAERTVYHTERYELNVGAGYNGFGNVYSVPVTITGIIHEDSIRYGAAIGYAFSKEIDGRGTNGTVLGLVLGYQLTRGVNGANVDVRYNFISGSDDELDGFSITAGMKF